MEDRWNLIANPYPAYIALNNAAKNASSATGSFFFILILSRRMLIGISHGSGNNFGFNNIRLLFQ